MQLIQTCQVKFDETVVAVSLINADELVLLLSTGQVVLYRVSTNTYGSLFSVMNPQGVTYSDGGFDITAPCSIYSLEGVVVVVNDYKTHGYAFNLRNSRLVHLQRECYHCDISRYPIATFRDNLGTAHLIYGQAWNHLQIMNFDTLQILTATKSLIKENAEEEHLAFYKSYPEENKSPWPREYDYFFGQLLMSSNKKHFLSKGWVWGSADAYNVFSVDDFIQNSRIREHPIGHWEHSSRPACWFDNVTVAIAYSPFEEGDENATKEALIELHLYDISQKEALLVNRIALSNTITLFRDVYYNSRTALFMAFHEEQGVTFYDQNGQIVLRESILRPEAYHEESNLLVTLSGGNVTLYQTGR